MRHDQIIQIEQTLLSNSGSKVEGIRIKKGCNFTLIIIILWTDAETLNIEYPA